MSDDHSPRSWLQAGQAIGAVLLHAAEVGVMGQPLAQVTDFDAGRYRLRAVLGLVGVPQMAIRMGYPDVRPGSLEDGTTKGRRRPRCAPAYRPRSRTGPKSYVARRSTPRWRLSDQHHATERTLADRQLWNPLPNRV